MAGITGLLVASIVAAIVSAGAGIFGTVYNANKTQEYNDKNLANQNAINAANLGNQRYINQQNIDYSREFAQNQIQWRMDDMQNAGLNPTLAVSGFGGSSPAAMSSSNQQATRQTPPMLDMSGVSSAITALNNSMLTAYLIESRENMSEDRNDVLRALYKRKGVALDSSHDLPYVGTSRQAFDSRNGDWEKDWDDMLKALKRGKFK